MRYSRGTYTTRYLTICFMLSWCIVNVENNTEEPVSLNYGVDGHTPPAYARSNDRVEVHEILEDSQLTAEERQFYVCPPATGSTLVRFESPRDCPKHYKDKDWREGIGVLFRERLSTYKFKVVIYYKNVISTETWSGSTYQQIINRYVDRTPVGMDEIVDLIDAKGQCSSKAKYLRNNHMVEAFDRDDNAKDVPLTRSKFSTGESPAWHTTNETYTVFGSAWTKRYGTSVNCIVEQLWARSQYPYDFFALSNGVIIEASPFYGYNPPEAAKEPMGYPSDRFKQVENYKAFDPVTGQTSERATRRNWIMTHEYTVAWDWEPKRERVCSMEQWRVVDEMLSAKVSDTRIRFTSRELSATFIANITEFNPDQIILGDCIKRESSDITERIFNDKYSSTHVKNGQIRYYLLLGGYLLAYQPIVSRTLANMYIKELLNDNRTDEALDLAARQAAAASNATFRSAVTSNRHGHSSLSRFRRSIAAEVAGPGGLTENTVIKSTASIHFAMLQFLYDNIQQHVNEMFSRVAVSWCELQNRESTLWTQVSYLNPAAVISANLGGRHVSAKILGDAIAVSSCFAIPASQAVLQNSMKDPLNPKICYSRPLVMFTYTSDVDGEMITHEEILGQLGQDNELIPAPDMKEPCVSGQVRYFLFGNKYARFTDYTYSGMVEVSQLTTLTTFVDLNLTLLEDREILPLEVFTKEEIRDSGVLNFAEVSRRNQLHDIKFYDLNKVIEVDTNYAFMAGLTEFFSGLGTVGKAVGKVIVGAAGAVVSTVSGISSFLSNPFGALAIGGIVVAAVIVAFLAYRYVNKLRADPMRALYPITTAQLRQDGEKAARARNDPESEDEGIDDEKLERAREMIKLMTLLSASERQQKKTKKKNRTTAKLAQHLNDMRLRAIRHRRPGPAYERLDNDDDEDELKRSGDKII